MIKNVSFFILTFCLIVLSFACAQRGNTFFLNHFGQDGSNSYTTGDNTYLDNSWGYNDYTFNKPHLHYSHSEQHQVRDTGTRDFPCCGQSVFFDLDFNKH